MLKYGFTYLTDFWEIEWSVIVKKTADMFKSCLNGGHVVSLGSLCRMTAALLSSLPWGVFVLSFTMWYAFRSFSDFPRVLLLDWNHQETFRAFLFFSDSRGMMGDFICLHNGRLCSTEELVYGKNSNKDLGPESNFCIDDSFDLMPLHNLNLIYSLF